MTEEIDIRTIKGREYRTLGKLMVDVYSKLDGFPSPEEQPDYYQMLSNVGSLNKQEHTKVLVAENSDKRLVGGVVYYDNMSVYGSGGTATLEKNSSGIRLLCVDTNARKMGIGKLLTQECIRLAQVNKSKQIILHTTQAMDIAWKLYLKLGFVRSADLDFSQKELLIYGFKLELSQI